MIQPDAKELPALVRDLHRQGTAWLPCGLGSRLDWGGQLRHPCLPLSCARLNGIVEHNPGDFTVTVRAGTPLAELQAALALHRQWLALDLPWGSERSMGCGSIGGLVARGLSGGYRQRYLGLRDQLLGIGLLRADGVAARAGGRVVKNVAGYDLMRLLCGSWGSLALITELTLRTQPLPLRRCGLLLQGAPASLAPLAGWLLGSGLTPERVDWWSASLAASAGLARQPLLLIGLASLSAASLAEQSEAIGRRSDRPLRSLEAAELAGLLAIGRGRPGAGEPRSDPGWLLRFGISSVHLPGLLDREELQPLAVEAAAGSGIGQIWSPPGAADALSGERVERLRQQLRQLGGWLSVLRQPSPATLPAWLDAPSRPLIEAVKRSFDPRGQLAPGRLPGVASSLASIPAAPGG